MEQKIETALTWLIGLGGVWIFIVGLLYFLPTLIAALRLRKNFLPILILNVIFGITVLGWWVALIWAISTPSKDQPAVIIHQSGNNVYEPAQSVKPPSTSADLAVAVTERPLSSDKPDTNFDRFEALDSLAKVAGAGLLDDDESELLKQVLLSQK